MPINAPIIDVQIAIDVIGQIEAKAELSHLRVKKYRNFLTIYSFEGKSSKRHARLALGEDSSWQLHLPIGNDDWEMTRLCRTLEDVMQTLLGDCLNGLAQGPDALRLDVIRIGYLG